VEGYNLTQQEPMLIPFDWFFAINEFNGPSAGNCREEAILQGICEVVERHVSSIISRDRRACPAIRPDSATDAAVVAMLEKYCRAGIRFYLSDFTLDMGIPTVAMLAYDPTTFPYLSEIVWTAGTTPDPEKALSRTLTEVAQLAGDFNRGTNYVASGLPKFTDLDDARYITNPAKTVDITDLPNLSDDNIRMEIENCVAALARRDMDVLVIDTTHPDLDIPAFYTIIPGAHFRERAAGTSVGMFTAKLITQKFSAEESIKRLKAINRRMPGKYYIQFYLGSAYLIRGETDAALDAFRNALNLHPCNEDIPSIYMYIGTCLKEKGQYRQALDALRQGKQYDRDRTDIHNLMGFCHFKLKSHDAAIGCFKRVLALNPGSAIDYANIAVNYKEMGKTDRAIEYFETALNLDPSIDFARAGLSGLKKMAKD
jgi:ribosomal protein S12 methylthiotransferase accessory factor